MRKLLLTFLAILIATVSVSCGNNKDDVGVTPTVNISDKIRAGETISLIDLYFLSSGNSYGWFFQELGESCYKESVSDDYKVIPDITKVACIEAGVNQDGKYIAKTAKEKVFDFNINNEDISGKSLKANKNFAEQEITNFPTGSELIKLTSNEPKIEDFVVDANEIAVLERLTACYKPEGRNTTGVTPIVTPIVDGVLNLEYDNNYKLEISGWETETPTIKFDYKDNSVRYSSYRPFNTIERKLPTTNGEVKKQANASLGRADTYVIKFDNGFSFVIFQAGNATPATQNCLAEYTFDDRDNYRNYFNKIASEYIAEKWKVN